LVPTWLDCEGFEPNYWSYRRQKKKKKKKKKQKKKIGGS
jgi:hypothetical protein